MSHEPFVRPWVTKARGARYGTVATYRLAAEWLADCRTVGDWGGGRGFLSRFLKPDQVYTLIDGTEQKEALVPMRVADVRTYQEPSDGIVLRHILEVLGDAWRTTLQNALQIFKKRMVVITCTPDAPQTQLYRYDLTWPLQQFNHAKDLLPLMQPYLVRVQDVPGELKRYPERVYLLEKSEATR